MCYTTFYKLLNRYIEGGELALANKPISKGKQPPQTPEGIEKAIMDFSPKLLTAGPQLISNELRNADILVGKMVAYNALKRDELSIGSTDI